MTIQLSTLVRDAVLNAIEQTIGASARLHIYSGSKPAQTTDAPTGTLLVDMALPADWMAAAASGLKEKLGTWTGTGTAGAGTGTPAGYFRVMNSAGSVCGIQGTVTVTGGGGDMTLVNTSIAQNQVVAVNTFTLTAGNP